MQIFTMALLASVVIAAFAMKLETLRIFLNVQNEIFRSDELPPWMLRIITVMAVIAALLGFYLAWRYPSGLRR